MFTEKTVAYYRLRIIKKTLNFVLTYVKLSFRVRGRIHFVEGYITELDIIILFVLVFNCIDKENCICLLMSFFILLFS